MHGGTAPDRRSSGPAGVTDKQPPLLNGLRNGRRSVAAPSRDPGGLVGRADKSCMDAERDTQRGGDCCLVSGLRGQIVCLVRCDYAA